MRVLSFVLCLLVPFTGGACRHSGARTNANQAAGAATPAPPNANAQALASGQLDAEIARLEAEAEQNPDDPTTRTAVATAHVRRGDALRAAGRPAEALRDYQAALQFNPDNEEAQLGAEQVQQETGTEPTAEDGRPVTVPAKPGKQ